MVVTWLLYSTGLSTTDARYACNDRDSDAVVKVGSDAVVTVAPGLSQLSRRARAPHILASTSPHFNTLGPSDA